MIYLLVKSPAVHVSPSQKNRTQDTRVQPQPENAKLHLKRQEKTLSVDNFGSISTQNSSSHTTSNLNLISKAHLMGATPNKDCDDKLMDKQPPRSRSFKALVSPRNLSKEDIFDPKIHRMKNSMPLVATSSRSKTAILPSPTKQANNSTNIVNSNSKKGPVSAQIDLFALKNPETIKTSKETNLSVVIVEVDSIYHDLKNKLSNTKLDVKQNKSIMKAFNNIKAIISTTASLIK